MPGVVRRPYTSYDLSGKYPQVDWNQDSAEPPNFAFEDAYDYGRETPCFDRGRESPRPYSPAHRSPSPRQCHSRAQSRLLASRPASQQAQITQTEQRSPRKHQSTQATSHIHYDPFTRHYFERLCADSGPMLLSHPINRQGRMGSTWRHVNTCYGSKGDHIAFIEGSVKQSDNTHFPPTYVKPTEIYTYVSPRLVPNRPKSVYGVSGKRNVNISNSYNTRAKQGFKYWYREEKPIDLAGRFRMKAKMLGTGVVPGSVNV